MKTTRKLLIICLVLLMGVVSIMPSTFSWYNHNGNLEGNKIQYIRNNLPVSAGDISITTKKFRMETDTIIYYDNKGNREYTDAVSTNESVSAKHNQYYGTIIKNTANSPAYVNLYLKNFLNNNNFYVGTIAPSLRDKGVSSSVHLKNKNSIRVYFQWFNANNWNAQNAKTYVVYKTKTSSSWTSEEITNHLTAGTVNSALRDRQNEILSSTNSDDNNIVKTYYVDLADNTTEFYFATDAGTASNFTASTGATKIPWYRTNTITEVHSERAYYLTNSPDDTTWHVMYKSFEVSGGVSILKYFDKAELNNGHTAYISMNEGVHYTGHNISYERTSGSGLNVNTGSGLITRTGTSDATVTTTITGSLGDTATVDTDVSTPPSIAAMPLAMNIKVPANGSTEVVWYIRNKDASTACTFNSVYYTK